MTGGVWQMCQDVAYREYWDKNNAEALAVNPVLNVPIVLSSVQKSPIIKASKGPCVHLGEETGNKVQCPTCNGIVMLKTFKCSLFGECTTAKPVKETACFILGLQRLPGKGITMSTYYQDTGAGLSQQVTTSGTGTSVAALLSLTGTAAQCNSVLIQNNDATNIILFGYSAGTCVIALAPAASAGVGGGSITVKDINLANIFLKAASGSPVANIAARI